VDERQRIKCWFNGDEINKIVSFNMIHPVVLYQYIIITVRQQTQQYLEIVILFNIHGYMFRLSFVSFEMQGKYRGL